MNTDDINRLFDEAAHAEKLFRMGVRKVNPLHKANRELQQLDAERQAKRLTPTVVTKGAKTNGKAKHV